MHIRSTQCVFCKNGCSLCWPFELSPLNELYMGKLNCASITLVSFEIFWWHSGYMYIRSRRCVMCNKGCSPLLANALYRGTLVRSINLVPFKICWWYLAYMYIRSRRCVTCKNGCSPLLSFWIISLEWFYRGKLVSSLIANIPYVLALTLNIISWNI